MVSVQNISTALNKIRHLKTSGLYSVSFPICVTRPHCWEVFYARKVGEASIAETPSLLHKKARSSWGLDFYTLKWTRYCTQAYFPSRVLQLHAVLKHKGTEMKQPPSLNLFSRETSSIEGGTYYRWQFVVKLSGWVVSWTSYVLVLMRRGKICIYWGRTTAQTKLMNTDTNFKGVW